ncbi:MAG: hypothetical protein JWN70_445 [Planctomycetaceae bacterium]|nr:hypothetical protein [Planctomycetaceae bacterium]
MTAKKRLHCPQMLQSRYTSHGYPKRQWFKLFFAHVNLGYSLTTLMSFLFDG